MINQTEQYIDKYCEVLFSTFAYEMSDCSIRVFVKIVCSIRVFKGTYVIDMYS